MKNRTLTLLAACLMGVSAFAEWTGTAPTLPSISAGSLEDGHYYQIMLDYGSNSALENMFLQGGQTWFTFSTSLIIDSRDNAITYQLEKSTQPILDEDGNETGKSVEAWTLMDISTNKYTFVSYDDIDDEYDETTGDLVSKGTHSLYGAMHIDMGSQGHQYFQITESGNTGNAYSPAYRITISSSDDTYAEHSGKDYVGTIPSDDYQGAVYAFLDPSTTGNYCDWVLVDMTVYEARLDLYNVLLESNNYTIDGSVISSANSTYLDDNASVDDLVEAKENVIEARNAAVLEGATIDDPKNVTILLSNTTFDEDIIGWTCTFTSGVSATNIGWQNGGPYTNTSYTYVNGDGEVTYPNCTYFLEAWTLNQYGDTSVSESLGDGQLSQTVTDAPAGTYMLSVDVVACQQRETVEQAGVQLFATDTGGDDFWELLSTGNEVPEHVTLFFYTDGGTLTLGLRTFNTNCNWIAADNFELLYFGDTEDVSKVELSYTISGAETTYSDLSEVFADAEVKSAYETALSSAKSTLSSGSSDTEYEAATADLNTALETLKASIEEYQTVADYLDYLTTLQNQCLSSGWDELAAELSVFQENLSGNYYDGALSSDDIANMETEGSEMIANYISENVEPGSDISVLIVNNDFDTDFSGWTVDPNGATPAWGGSTSLQGENTLEGGTLIADIGSGCAEVYQAAFDICQTIKNMPVGVYTLSCQAFERDDNGNGIEAELYAVTADGTQTQKVEDIYAEAQDEPLYSCGEWYDDAAVINGNDTTYIPNGMNGADVWFYRDHYKNSFDIILREQGDITFGIRTASTGDWVLFDTFRLVYGGNTADLYYSTIEGLIEEAEALQNEFITEDAYSMLETAITTGANLVDNSSDDVDACLAAIDDLEAAIDYANSSMETISALQELYDYTNSVRMDKIDADDDYYELLDAVDAALNDDKVVESVEQAETWIHDMKSDYNKLVMAAATEATEDEPADVTAVIINPTYVETIDNEETASSFGWTVADNPADGGTYAPNYNCFELYNQKTGASLSQILYNLSAGYYRLHVQGFYRGTGYNETVDAAAADTMDIDTIHAADIYAGETATRMCSIISDAEAYDEMQGTGSGAANGIWYIPTGMSTAQNAFENDLYNNTLQFQVEEDDTDVEIGVVKTGHIDADWTIFSNWTLEYLGTTEPLTDPTTAIAEVEGADAPVAVAIFTVDGKQTSSLTKGINIIKTTMADGTVKVSKVLVK
ncbi:MAG: hypothetical protein LUC33_02585 [Prevotellaceae bacterium]|nr:hypothetical protein [Prevotellaceae bacterium]